MKTQIPFENNWKPIEITEQVVLIITLQIMQMKNNVFRNYVYELKELNSQQKQLLSDKMVQEHFNR